MRPLGLSGIAPGLAVTGDPFGASPDWVPVAAIVRGTV